MFLLLGNIVSSVCLFIYFSFFLITKREHRVFFRPGHLKINCLACECSVWTCLSELSWIMWELAGLPVMLLMCPVQSACSTSQEFLSSGIRKVGLPCRSGANVCRCVCVSSAVWFCLFSIQWNGSPTSTVATKLSRDSHFNYFLLTTSRGEFKVQSISAFTGIQFSQPFWFPGITKTWAHWRYVAKDHCGG